MKKLLIKFFENRQRSRKIEWSSKSLVHNLFRIYEQLFGRKKGIRCENSTMAWVDKTGRMHIKREFFTWEALLVYVEQTIIGFFLPSFWKSLFEFLKQNHQKLAFTASILGFIHFTFNADKWISLVIGAVGFDLATTSTATGTSVSFSHTTSGSSRVLLGSGHGNSGDVTALTYAGTSLTSQIASNGANGTSEIWTLTAPATGANTIAFTWDLAPANQAQIAYSYTGSSGTIGITGSENANSQPSVTVTTQTNNSWVIDSLQTSTGDVEDATVGAGQTQRFNFKTGNAPHAGSDEVTTTAGSYTMSWTYGIARSHALVVLELKEGTQAGGAAPILGLLLLGIG